MSEIPLKRNVPNYCCPYCTKPVGYLGRGLAWLFGTKIHRCDFSNVADLCRWEALENGCSCAMPCDTTDVDAVRAGRAALAEKEGMR